MEFTVHQQRDVVIVVLNGELDVALAPQLKALLKETIEKGHQKIVVDMKDVLFVDSSCLGVMVNAHKLAVGLKAFDKIRAVERAGAENLRIDADRQTPFFS